MTPLERFQNNEPGVYAGITDAWYHRSRLNSNSTMSMLTGKKGCPARIKYHRENPDPVPTSPPRVQDAALDIGSALHPALLQPDLVAEHVVELPNLDYRRPADRQRYKEIREQQPGKVYLRPETWEKVQRMADAVRTAPEHAETREVLELAGPRELTLVQDLPGHHDVARTKARIDLAAPSALALGDLKTCESAHPDDFGAHAARMGYHRQAAVYTDCFDLAHRRGMIDWSPDTFIFVAIEKQPPYLPGVYRVKKQDLMESRQEYRRLLDIYARCLAENNWPGYHEVGEPIMDLRLPGWLFGRRGRQDESDLTGLIY